MIPTFLKIKCDMCYNGRSVLEIIAVVAYSVHKSKRFANNIFDSKCQWIVILVEFYR